MEVYNTLGIHMRNATGFLREVDKMAKLADEFILASVKDIQGGETGYIAFNDETGFPKYHYDNDDMTGEVYGVRIRKNKRGVDVLQFFTDDCSIDEIDGDTGWFLASQEGEYDRSDLMDCLWEYALKNELVDGSDVPV